MNAPQKRRTQPGKGWVRDCTHNTSASNPITTATPAQQLLPRLEGVITTGKGWRARCPAHGGKSASLAITEGDNGTLLLQRTNFPFFASGTDARWRALWMDPTYGGPAGANEWIDVGRFYVSVGRAAEAIFASGFEAAN